MFSVGKLVRLLKLNFKVQNKVKVILQHFHFLDITL